MSDEPDDPFEVVTENPHAREAQRVEHGVRQALATQLALDRLVRQDVDGSGHGQASVTRGANTDCLALIDDGSATKLDGACDRCGFPVVQGLCRRADDEPLEMLEPTSPSVANLIEPASTRSAVMSAPGRPLFRPSSNSARTTSTITTSFGSARRIATLASTTRTTEGSSRQQGGLIGRAPFDLHVAEHAKRQLEREGIAFTALDNGVLSCADPERLQAICDGLSPDKIDALLRKWLRLLPHPFTGADRLAGYRYDVSILQAEFGLTRRHLT